MEIINKLSNKAMKNCEEIVKIEAVFEGRGNLIHEVVDVTIPPYSDEYARAKCIDEAMTLWLIQKGFSFTYRELEDDNE